jgi:TonB family protein
MLVPLGAAVPGLADHGPLPVATHNCPDYPADALAEDSSGQTAVAFQVATDGSPTDLRVEQSSGDGRLDQAAMRCVSAWRYEPAIIDGRPAAVSWKTVIRWQIDTEMPLVKPGTTHDCAIWRQTADEPGHAYSPVMIDFAIDATGAVQGPFVGVSSGDETFDEFARQCVAGWKYLPATRNGTAVDISWGARIVWKPGAGIVVTENFAKPHLCNLKPKEAPDAQGTAVLSFVIDTSGHAVKVSVTQSSGNRYLDKLATYCAGRFRYKPAAQNGSPVSSPWGVQITWRGNHAFVLELDPNR